MPVAPVFRVVSVRTAVSAALAGLVLAALTVPVAGPPVGRGDAIHKDVTYELEEYPEDKTEERLEKHVAPAIRGHMRDFLRAIGDRSRPVADIEDGYISTAACILANNALTLGRTLTWDARKGEVAGDAEANRQLRRPYRKPWTHPG